MAAAEGRSLTMLAQGDAVLMMDIKLKYEDAKAVMFISGNLAEEHAVKLWESLFTALGNTDCVELNLEGVTAIDQSCVETLGLSQQMAMQLSKSLVITGKLPERLIRIVDADGLLVMPSSAAGIARPAVSETRCKVKAL